MWTSPSLTGTDVLIHVTSSSSLQQNAYWNIAQDGNITQLNTRQQYNIRSFKKAKWPSRFYLQDSIKDEELHEEEITISRSLVHIDNSSLGCLTLKAHSNGVYHFELKTFKLQIWVSKVVDVAGIYWMSRKGNPQWEQSWSSSSTRRSKHRRRCRTSDCLYFQRLEEERGSVVSSPLFKAKSSWHCCIHLWESRKCDLFRSKLLREHDLKWEAVNDSPDSGLSPMENQLSRDLGCCCSFSPSSLTVLLIL